MSKETIAHTFMILEIHSLQLRVSEIAGKVVDLVFTTLVVTATSNLRWAVHQAEETT